MTYFGVAEDNTAPDEWREQRSPRSARRRPEAPKFTSAGERIPPIAKGFKRTACTWVHGSGWVFNPSGKVIV